MRIQIASDLHVESTQYDLPIADADVLVLAGDIGTPNCSAVPLIKKHAVTKPVIYVPGNHEYYGSDIGGMNLYYYDAMPENAYFCAMRTLYIQNTLFVCCTLWSDGWGDAFNRWLAQKNVSDFRVIKNGYLTWTMEMAALVHRDHAKFLKDNVLQGCVVVTHFPPSKRCIHEKWKGDPLNPYFVNDMDKFIEQSGAALWVCGHTHSAFDLKIGKTRVVGNPRGYNKHENPHFKPKFVVEV